MGCLDPDDGNHFELDGDSTKINVDFIEADDFSPDYLFSELTKVFDVAVLTVEQATEVGVDDDVWESVDVGLGPVQFATAEELAAAQR